MKLEIKDPIDGSITEETPEQAFAGIREGFRILEDDEDATLADTLEIVARVHMLMKHDLLQLKEKP